MPPIADNQNQNQMWFINGVSLPYPPWPHNLIMCRAVLLSSVHTRRLGEPNRCASDLDRMRRIRINLVILFRIVTQCKHLAFDRLRFWDFVRRIWGCNTSSHQTEELVNIYVGRRLKYLRNPNIRHRHNDLLTDLIDAWMEEEDDNESLPSAKLPQAVIHAAWKEVIEAWDEQVGSGLEFLLDPDNPPIVGTFPVRRETPPPFRIKGSSSRSRDSNERSLNGDFTIKKNIIQKNGTAPATAADGIFMKTEFENAIDELIGTQGKKRQMESKSHAPPLKRQCVTESRQLPDSTTTLGPKPQLDERIVFTQDARPVVDAVDRHRQVISTHQQDAAIPEKDKRLSDHEKGRLLEEDDAQLHEQVTTEPEQNTMHVEQSTSHSEQVTPVQDENTLKSLEARFNAQHDRMQVLNDRTKLLIESGELSRDIQKTHNDLALCTASKCQEALDTLDVVSGRLSALAEEVAACRRAAQEKQQQLHQRHEVHESRIDTMNSRLEWATRSVQSIETRLETQDRVRRSTDARLHILESALEEQDDPQAHLSSEIEQRLKKVEDAYMTNSALIENCRSMIEISRTSMDQQFSAFCNRMKRLEQRFAHHAAEQSTVSKEQAKRTEQLMDELKQYRDNPTVPGSEIPRPPPQPADRNNIQLQLGVLRNSLAAIARASTLASTGESSGTSPQRSFQDGNDHRPYSQRQEDVPAIGSTPSNSHNAPTIIKLE